MPYSLVFDFEVTTTKEHIYWWPLICDVLAQYGFQFADPDVSERKSGYLYTRQGETTDILVGSFRDFWDEINAGVEVMTAIFWYQGNSFRTTPLILEITAQRKLEESTFQISLDMPGANVMMELAEDVRSILKLVLACAKRLYEVCLPHSGVSYWTTPGPDTTPWAVFGKPLFQPFGIGYPGDKPQQQVVTQTLADGNVLYFFDPVPYASSKTDMHRRRLTYISLLDG